MNTRKWAPAAAVVALLGGTALTAGCGTSTDATGASETGAHQSASPSTYSATANSAAAVSGAWDNCPKGLTDDPYPGECSRYVDSNDDGICDLSQSDPSESSSAISLALATATPADPSTGGCPLGPCVACGICVSLSQV
jgi:hypothetical protein